MSTLSSSESLLQPLKRLHESIRQTVVDACERMSMESVAAIAREEEGDTIYAVDYLTEDLLIDFFAREIAPAREFRHRTNLASSRDTVDCFRHDTVCRRSMRARAARCPRRRSAGDAWSAR